MQIQVKKGFHNNYEQRTPKADSPLNTSEPSWSHVESIASKLHKDELHSYLREYDSSVIRVEDLVKSLANYLRYKDTENKSVK